MKRNRWIVAAVSAAMLISGLSACSSSGNSPSATTSDVGSTTDAGSTGNAAPTGDTGSAGGPLKGKLVWYMGVTAANPATNAIAQGIAHAVTASGAQFVRSFALNSTSGQIDLGLQAQSFTRAVNQHADALAYFLISPSAPKPQIEAAEKAGIPVFAAFGQPEGFTVNAYINNPDYQQGYATAQYLAQHLPKGAKVTILSGPDTLNVNNEVKGAQAALKDAGADLVGSIDAQRNLKDNTAGGQATMQGILQRYPDVKGVFVYNDDSAIGAIAAAKAAGKKIAFVSRNGESVAVAAVKSGSLLATCDIKPLELGEALGTAIVDQLEGKQDYKNTQLQAPPAKGCLVTKDNVASWQPPEKQISYIDIPTK